MKRKCSNNIYPVVARTSSTASKKRGNNNLRNNLSRFMFSSVLGKIDIFKVK